MPAVEDFLQWFEAELKIEPALQRCTSRTLDALEGRLGELTVELRRALDTALARAQAQPVFEGPVTVAKVTW